ncbi:MAG: leucyl/phenylalanyl-tRNA--protein transferase [Novosphingobium sp.]
MIEPQLLLLAYRSGVFPMADSREDTEVFWVEPRRRAILPLDGLHVSRSLAKVIRRDSFTVTCNRAFGDVMLACAGPRRDGGDTWISGRIEMSYRKLHELGAAHSIEVWQGEALVGGLYGVGFDRVFCGESMFSRVPDASKVALVWLVAALRRAGVELLDCQFITPHLATMGAVEITQGRYKKLLSAAQRVAGEADADGLGAAGAGEALSLPEGFGALLAEVAGAGSSSSPGKRMLQSFTQTS